MKTIGVLLAATAVQGYLLPPKTHKIDWRYEQKRQIVGTITSLLGKGGKVSHPAGAAPLRVNLQSDSPITGVKRVKIRNGPYQVPNINRTSLVGESGMLWNFPDLSITKPCTSCVLVGQWAGLEFPNGNNANIDSGMWLHHMVSINSGSGRYDPTCIGKSSLPHVDVNASPSSSERYFSSGNERSQVHLDILGSGKTKWGYQLGMADRFGFIVDLMNINTEDKTVYLTMYYDFFEGGLPSGWKNIRVIWLDANQCGTSEVWPPKQSGQFAVSTSKWTASFEGEIIGVGSHLHDGGVGTDIYIGSTSICSSRAGYAETPEYIQKAGMGHGGSSGGHGGHGDMPHISSMSLCYPEAIPKGNARNINAADKVGIARVQKGQSWYASGKYDYDKYGGMKSASGRQDEIMVISLIYVAATS